MKKKTITLEQLKDTLRYTYGDQYAMTDLTDYDNWVGFTHFCETVWHNLDKRTKKTKKLELRKKPIRYIPVIRLPFLGQLYKQEKS